MTAIPSHKSNMSLGFTALNQITARAMLADREIFCLIERTITQGVAVMTTYQ